MGRYGRTNSAREGQSRSLRKPGQTRAGAITGPVSTWTRRTVTADLQLPEIRMPGIQNVVELPIDHDAGYLQHGRACLPYPLSTELTRRGWSGHLTPILG